MLNMPEIITTPSRTRAAVIAALPVVLVALLLITLPMDVAVGAIAGLFMIAVAAGVLLYTARTREQ
jgi:hypothetical protein